MKFKQQLILLGVILSANVMGGSIDYLSQQDAEYLAHPAMVGKIGVSGAYYNPAGTVWLEDGTYIQVSNQTHLKDYSMEYGSYRFESDKASPVVPSLQIVKKKGDTAFFFHAGAIAGGGNVAYTGGIATFPQIADDKFGQIGGNFTEGSTIHGKSYYVAFQGGIARKFNEAWSGAVGLRLIDAERKFKGEGNFEVLGGAIKPKFDIDSERTAFGVAGIFGLNYHPNDRFNLGMRYETETKLDFDNKEHKLKNGFNNSVPSITIPGLVTISGNTFYDIIAKDPAIKQWMAEGSGKRNLPAMAAIGASYRATDKLTLLASGNYYFIKEASDDLGNFDHYDNGYEVAVGVDYQLYERWTLMAGYQYTNTGANEKTYTDTDYVLNANMYSTGVKYRYSSQLELLAAYSYVDYVTDKNVKNIRYSKHVDAFGLGLIYKF